RIRAGAAGERCRARRLGARTGKIEDGNDVVRRPRKPWHGSARGRGGFERRGRERRDARNDDGRSHDAHEQDPADQPARRAHDRAEGERHAHHALRLENASGHRRIVDRKPDARRRNDGAGRRDGQEMKTAALGLAAALAALSTLGAAGCPRHAADSIPILPIGGDFTLTDHNGQPFELSSLRGKVVLLFFGYTFCPDACPTTLSKLASVSRKLGDDAKRVKTLYVSVDPGRDTPAVMKDDLSNFDV